MYTMEFYSAINKIEIKKGAGKWMELERLREVIEAQKDKHRDTVCSLSYLDPTLKF